MLEAEVEPPVLELEVELMEESIEDEQAKEEG